MTAPKLYPPRDLARLVLGYLEEEECMSAYNEFMKCSPHLEDFRRDYNSAIMSNFTLKSLKDLFGEYCSYKSYIHTCRIPGLRKRLIQCKTILDTAQLFIDNIDFKKLQAEDERRHCPSSNRNVQSLTPNKTCDVCTSDNCECRLRSDAAQNITAATQQDVPPHETQSVPAQQLDMINIMPNVLVETTQLSDLPGTCTSRRHDTVSMQYAHNTEHQLGPQASTSMAHDGSQFFMQMHNPVPGTGTMANTSMATKDFTDGGCDNSSTMKVQFSQSSDWPANPVPATTKAMNTGNTSFHDFALAIPSAHRVGGVTSSSTIPDSSTPETNTYQVTNSLQRYASSHRTENVTNRPQPLRRTHERRSGVECEDGVCGPEPSIEKSTSTVSPKITILSNDIIATANDGTLILKKEGKALRRLSGKPPGLIASNPTPKSVVNINGLPAYATQEVYTSREVYTEEQIMAMPTVIVLQPQTSEQFASGTSRTVNTTASNSTTSAPTSLQGSSDTCPRSQSQPAPQSSKRFLPSAPMPTETVSLEKTSTPNNPLVAKKAASTPRRNSSSHVRVLDFTTPRRLLPAHEENETSNKDKVPSDVNQIESEAVKIDTVKKPKKSNWDADLRALLPSYDPPPPKKPRAKKKSPVKSEKTADKIKKRRKSRKKSEDKGIDVQCEPSKSERTVDNDVASGVQETVQSKPAAIKPTINLIHKDREVIKPTDPIPVDTPENDFRPPDSNPPSAAKHNLSDLFLLQTPYKTMVDNLHMETPRFIDSSVFDVPMSDIKIDNIPTPNFLNTPNFLLTAGKGVAATPSSYSSRPTDYSSGGSYYKPDELDFNPSPDLKRSSPSMSTSASKKDCAKTPKSKVKKDSAPTSSRPRRQCTLKVSYFESKTAGESKSAHTTGRSSRSLSVSSVASNSSDSTVASKTLTPNTSDSAKEKGKGKENKNINKSKEEILANLEAKRRRTIVSLRKKTPIKRKRSSTGSFPKVKLSAKKLLVKKPKTVAELRQTITPRKMANLSKDKLKKKSLIKEVSCVHSASTSKTSTKSRRKSSTPRKVEHYLVHSLDDSASTDAIAQRTEVDVATEDELPPLRMSFDDGSQDSRVRKYFSKDREESEDISQIRAYIETTAKTGQPVVKVDNEIASHTQTMDIGNIKFYLETTDSPLKQGVQEFVQRGFDIETAKSIERDLLSTPVIQSPTEAQNIIVDIREQLKSSDAAKIVVTIEQSPQHVPLPELPLYSQSSLHSPNRTESLNNSKNSTPKNSPKNHSSILLLESDIVMVRETFDANSTNHFIFCHDEKSESKNIEMDRIQKDFALDVMFEDAKLNVCLGEQTVLFDFPPMEIVENDETVSNQKNLQTNETADVADGAKTSSSSSDSDEETINAVRSITHMRSPFASMDTDSNLHRQTCIDIFDSTLNSLDTPIKSFTKSGNATPHSENDRTNDNVGASLKRKKPSSSPDATESSDSTSKKTKPDHQTLIQCVDIESFLSKLHGDKE